MFVLLPQRPRQGPAAYIPRGYDQAAVRCRGARGRVLHPRKHAVVGRMKDETPLSTLVFIYT
jgi:hypothetical protein